MLGRATLAPFTGRGQGEGPGSVSRKPIASTNSARAGALWACAPSPSPQPSPRQRGEGEGRAFSVIARRRRRRGNPAAACDSWIASPSARNDDGGAKPSPTRGRTQPREARSDEGCWGAPPSPRLRGEGRVRGLGPYRESRSHQRIPRGAEHCGHVPQAPHPNPLPASGEREKGAPFPSLRGGEADAAIQRPHVTPGLLRLRLAMTEGA